MSSSAAFFSLFLRQVAQMAGPDNACFALPFHLFPPLWSPPDWLLLPITMRVEGRAREKKSVVRRKKKGKEKSKNLLRIFDWESAFFNSELPFSSWHKEQIEYFIVSVGKVEITLFRVYLRLSVYSKALLSFKVSEQSEQECELRNDSRCTEKKESKHLKPLLNENWHSGDYDERKTTDKLLRPRLKRSNKASLCHHQSDTTVESKG